MKKILYFSFICSLVITVKAQTVTDIDGNIYNTVTIGSQTWLKEDLKTTRLNDGTAIPNVKDSLDWANLRTLGYCWYDNIENNTAYPDIGAYYNWYVVETKKLCPVAWHVPTNKEIEALISHLGGVKVAGYKMRVPKIGDSRATNESGLSLRSYGNRFPTGEFRAIGSWGGWWSANIRESNEFQAFILHTYPNDIAFVGAMEKEYGLTVRCIKDTIVAEQYVVTFEVNGGSAIKTLTVVKNSMIAKPTDPVKNGYAFAGWYKGPGCINKWDFTTDVIIKDATLYAKWEDTAANSINQPALKHTHFYPNPAKDMLYFSENSKLMSVNIYNMQGKLVLSKKNTGKSLDISLLGSGIYQMELVTTNGEFKNKLIIN